MDGTLIIQETTDVMASLKGKEKEVAEITTLGMTGNLDFKVSVLRRLSIMNPSMDDFENISDNLDLSTGAVDLISFLKQNDFIVGIISGGFDPVAEKIAKRVGANFYIANSLNEVNNGLEVDFNVYNNKATLVSFLSELFQSEFVFAIGDGSNDLRMLQAANLGVVYKSTNLRGRLPQHSYIPENLYDSVELIRNFDGSKRMVSRSDELLNFHNHISNIDKPINLSLEYMLFTGKRILDLGQDESYAR